MAQATPGGGFSYRLEIGPKLGSESLASVHVRKGPLRITEWWQQQWLSAAIQKTWCGGNVNLIREKDAVVKELIVGPSIAGGLTNIAVQNHDHPKYRIWLHPVLKIRLVQNCSNGKYSTQN